MKKLLLSLCGLLCIVFYAAANTATVTFSENGYENAQDVTSFTIGSDISATASMGTSSNGPKYYNTGKGLRLYSGNELVIAGNNANVTITQIVFTFSTNSYTFGSPTVSPGSLSTSGATATWSGSANSISIKPTKTCRWQKVEVTYSLGEGAVNAPEFTPGGGDVEAGTQVTLACQDAEAKIYYTLDNTEPTNASTEYTAPIVINETTTVKAIAYVGDKASSVATATFTVVKPLNLQEANVLANGATFIFGSDLTVTYSHGAYVYVYDPSCGAYGLIYKENLGLTAGDVVKGGWTGSMTLYNSLPELVPTSALEKNGTASVPAPLTVTAASQINAENLNRPVLLKGVIFSEATPTDTKTNFTGSLAGADVTFRNTFGTASAAAGEYDVNAMLSVYGSTYQLLPVSYDTFQGVAVPLPSVEPGLYHNDITVALTCSTEGATINQQFFYENASTGGHEYKGEFTISEPCKLVVWAVKDGVESEHAEYVYDFQAADPVFDPASGYFQAMPQVSFKCDTEGATIYYTTDGSTPDEYSNKYTDPFTPELAEGAESLTVKAIAVRENYKNSDVAEAVYTIGEAPKEETVTFDFTVENPYGMTTYTGGSSSYNEDGMTISDGDVSITLNGNTRSWLTSGSYELRFQAGSSFVVATSGNVKITKIVLDAKTPSNFSLTQPASAAARVEAAYENGTWTGESQEVTFYCTISSKNTPINKITVTTTTTTGVEGVAVESAADEAPVYYNIQGARVANPTHGLYIKVTGNKATKVIL